MKKKLTYKEKAFVDEYLDSHNASAAYRASKWTLANPEEWVDSDRSNWMMMKRKEKIKAYLMEKIMTDADECLDIQMDLIRNEKTPAAVRNAAIVDRLNRMWIGKEKEESNEFTGIGEVTITIKHKKPDVIDMNTDVEVLDSNDGEENDGKQQCNIAVPLDFILLFRNGFVLVHDEIPPLCFLTGTWKKWKMICFCP